MPNYTTRLVPSAYQLSNTSYTNIQNPTNMYTNVDSTTYATFNHTRTQTTSYYLYIRGFDFSQIPSNATITSAVVKVKASVSGAGSYTPGLYNNTSSLSKSFNGTIGTTATTRTVDITSNWGTYKGYGNNFTIRLQLNRSSKNTASKMLIYGAEITVEYTVPNAYNVTSSANGCTIKPSGSTTVFEGDNYSLKIESNNKPTIKDNDVDVTNKLVEKEASIDYDVATAPGASYGFTMNSSGYYESTNKGKASSTSLCVVNMDLPVECTVKFKVINYAESTYDYGLLSNIDTTLSTSASADSTNVYWSGKNNNDSYEQTVTYTIPSGSHFVCAKYFKDSYTDSNNDSLQFKVEITPNETISANTYWEYTISNVNEDHIIVVSASTSSSKQMYVKVNGSWVTVGTVYKKINGAWVEQTDLESLFDTNTNYVKGN